MEKGFDGRKYEKFSQPQQDWGSRMMDELDLHGDECILDIGCGNGLLTEKLAMRVPDGRVIGIDSSASMLEQAKSHKAENMEFRLLDIETMIFEDEFDVVFSNAALHWIMDHPRVLDMIYKSMKKGGIMRAQFAGEGNCKNLSDVLMEAISSHEFKADFSSFEWPWYMPGKAEYEELLRSAGFEQYRVWIENADRSFPDEDSFVGWIEQPGIVPFVSVLPEGRTSVFRDVVVEKAKKVAEQSDGTFFEFFRRLNVYAIKK